MTGLAVYYIDDVLHAYGGGRFTILMGVLLLSQFLGTIIFGFVMPKTSKRTPILVGFPIRIVATVVLFFFSKSLLLPEGGVNMTFFYIILALCFVIGLGMAASSTSIYAILSDMADVDELITSINRPATCSAMATFIRKIATGLSSTVIGILLAMVGYNADLAKQGIAQSAATEHGIALIFVIAPIVLCVLTLFFAIIFPMSRDEFNIIRKEVQRRRGEEDSIITPEEIAVCEKVTGFKYDKLWDKNNALKMSNK